MFTTPVGAPKLRLQQDTSAAGDQFLGRFPFLPFRKPFAPPDLHAPLQTKLAVSEPKDALEKEPDRVADGAAALHRAFARSHRAPSQPFPNARFGSAPLSVTADSLEREAEEAAARPEAVVAPSKGTLAGVRMHHDARAATLAASLHARACTLGNDVYFGAGQYRPDSGRGRRLIAHELTHVAQQRHGAAHRLQRQEIDVELEAPTPQQQQRLSRLGVTLPTASAASADPRKFRDYVDNRVRSVGFGLTLGGFLLFVGGLDKPIFVPDAVVDFAMTNAEPVSLGVFSDSAAARQAIPIGPPAPGHGFPFNFFRGTGGIVFPTVFSPGTTPRAVRLMLDARRQFAEEAQQIFSGLALSMLGGAVLRFALPRLFRIGAPSETPPRPPRGRLRAGSSGPVPEQPLRSGGPQAKPRVDVEQRPTPPPPAKLEPVGGAINVGGELETPGITNLNNLSTPVRDPFAVKNLVVGDAEDIGLIFKPASANRIVSNRLPATVDFKRFARGAFQVLKPGGTLEVNIFGNSESPFVREALADFQAAGFDARLAPAPRPGFPGPGTIVARKP